MRRSRLLFLSFLTPVAASAQAVNAVPGTPFQTTALSSFATFGSELTGLSAQVTFAGGGTSSGSFADLGAGSFGISNADFSLRIPGASDTFGAAFTLQNLSASNLVGLTLRGSTGNLVFDRNVVGDTPGSAGGRDFIFATGALAGTTATYTNIVNLTGSPAFGDLFERLDVTLGSGGLAPAATLTYRMDIDEADVGAVVVPVSPVPEPGTVALLATGLLAVAGAAARRQRAA